MDKPAFTENDFQFLIDTLMNLIRIPSVAPGGEHYGEIAEYIASKLTQLGLDTEVVRVPMEYQKSNCKEAGGDSRLIVVARLGEGPLRLHYNGHYDVVPGGPGWSVTEPFKPVVVEGRIYGRGAVDMKGGLASMITAAKILSKSSLPEDLSLELSFVPDEEIGGDCGARYLLEKVLPEPPRYVVIPEPSSLNTPWIGHKGLLWLRVKVKGRSAHGSTPWLGRNAFLDAARFSLEIHRMASSILSHKITRYKVIPPEAVTPTMTIGGEAAVPGGGKINQVPGEFVFSIDRRLIPEENVEEVLKETLSILRWAAIQTSLDYEAEVVAKMEPVVSEPGDLYNALKESASEVGITQLEPVVCPGGLDLRYFIHKGSEGLAYGPRGDTAHAPDEYVEIEELRKLTMILALLPFKLTKR